MGLWRPATKIWFWTPKFRNRPYVQPPGFLKLISVLSIFSIVGTVIFHLVVTLGDVAASTSIDPSSALYISVLHFLLPFAIALSISTNSPISRLLILLYFLVLSGATVLGKGYLGSIVMNDTQRTTSAIGMLLGVCAYLFLSPKMRAYYALLRGDAVPMGTGDEAVELVENPWPGKRGKAVLEWLVDHLEIIVVLGLIVSVILAWHSMNSS